MHSSPVAASLALAVLVVLAGCTGTLVELSAEPATVPPAALAGTGYVHGNTTPVTFAPVVGVGPLVRDVRVTGWLSGYSRTTTDGDIAALVVLSTPDARVEGESVSPVTRLSDPEVVEWALGQVAAAGAGRGIDAGVNGLRPVDRETRTVLGQPVEVVSYAGTVSVEGEQAEVLLHLAVVEHEDDVVVALGVHGAALDERDRLLALVERVEHVGGAD